MTRIAASTGEVDKRTINGNNGTRRGKDKKPRQTIQQWRKRGMISAEGARKVHNDYKRNGCKGYRAAFCRPDLRFDSNGKALTKKCDRYEMLRVVKESDFINSTNS